MDHRPILCASLRYSCRMDVFDLALYQYLLIALTGLIAGMFGGMLGVGGSVIMIPGLTALLAPDGRHEHLFQAAAMLTNVFVAAPASWRHYKAGGIKREVLIWMLPIAIIFVLIGVVVSNLPVFQGHSGSIWLGRILAVFLVYVIYVNIEKLLKRKTLPGTDDSETDWHPPANVPTRAGAVGGSLGFTAGLLGIGGGALAVPLQQVLLKLPLRNCIANSSAVIVFSAGVGALAKNATLYLHHPDYGVFNGTAIAALLIPTAIVGAHLGASLTYILPVRLIRVLFVLLMIFAAWKMAFLPWNFSDVLG